MMRLIKGDCRDEMRKLIDEGVQVDLTVTSPPYDNLRDYEDLEWNFDVFKEVANLLYSITAEGGIIVWIVKDAVINGSETGTSFRQALYFKDIGFKLYDTMIYAKKGISFPTTNRYYDIFEYMFILSKGKPKTINLIKDRRNKTEGQKITSTERQKDGTIRKSHGLLHGKVTQPFGVRFNIWEYAIGRGNSAKDKVAFNHPAIMPIQLAKDHILSWSNDQDTVLDCFMGGGTTGVACQQLNRKFIGIEKVEKYYDICTKRIDTKQTTLI